MITGNDILEYHLNDWVSLKISRFHSFWCFLHTLSNGRFAVNSSDLNPGLITGFDQLYGKAIERFAKFNNSRYLNKLYIASAMAETRQDFISRITDHLNPAENRELVSLIDTLEPLFSETHWSINKPYINSISGNLISFSEKTDFSYEYSRIKKFFGVAEIDKITVMINPVTGLIRNAKIPLIENIVSLPVRISYDSEDCISYLGIILHEICHICFHTSVNSCFTGADEFTYGKTGYYIIDESLATAAGTAWIHEKACNMKKNGIWYSDPQIHYLSRLIYPEVKRYLETGRTVDKDFSEYLNMQYGLSRNISSFDDLNIDILIVAGSAIPSSRYIWQKLEDYYFAHGWLFRPEDTGIIRDTLGRIPPETPLIFILTGDEYLSTQEFIRSIPDTRHALYTTPCADSCTASEGDIFSGSERQCIILIISGQFSIDRALNLIRDKGLLLNKHRR